ncbi:YjfB family protein [Paenibacillus sp. JX-17]|uniref:YjfB family protein n=1 Tax=Paenibacillus lacisoli TaxID=3064525 RepID=A0ABT9CCE7_9BACL|nr:YjfB family protein [Paenibacillus sp. JX-17]MDO7906934.1 YjfB family protein [Paenibacillus sp. JX-17]
MDIAAMSMAMSQTQLAQQASIQVLNMAKEQAQSQGQGLVQLLQSSPSPHPNLGSRLDISI